MGLRIGKVVNVFPKSGQAKVEYEDTGSTSLPLHMLTFNREYSLPEVGEHVVTMHMDNASSSGFIFGTYYGADNSPAAETGYRKEFDQNAHAESVNGNYTLEARGIELKVDASNVKITNTGITMNAADVTMITPAGTVSVSSLIREMAELKEKVNGYDAAIRALEAAISNLENRIDNL